MISLFNAGLAAYVGALVFAVVYLMSSRRFFDMAANTLMAAGALIQTVYIGMRWVEAGRAPFSNMFESLVLFAWSVAVIYLILRIQRNIPWLGAAASVFSALALAHASTFEADIKPLMPALQSNWLSFHVLTCFLGYGGFAVAFLLGIGFLVADRSASKVKPETREALETVMTRTISFGFLFLTLGILTGAVWANSAWGTYWSWDPKETWSLITWFIYAIFLHCRFMRGWRGQASALISIIGFASVLFTYYGVNFLLSGLHSYAQ
ncbi:MAG: c-type cytochrome biogenesis protein CcsB [bacterium]